MKRNYYALALLVLLGITVAGTQVYVSGALKSFRQDVTTAYCYAQSGDYPAAKTLLYEISAKAKAQGPWLSLFVRRSLLDKAGETLATLPYYAQADNAADLSVEIFRAYAQLTQIEQSFIAVF
ncbi:MAG: DUF4363 family protein [Gemmiger sp.]|nr:DUF4363 family protein [Gemmiger sp.]